MADADPPLAVILLRLDNLDQAVRDVRGSIDRLQFVPLARYEAEQTAARDREKALHKRIDDANEENRKLNERLTYVGRLLAGGLVTSVIGAVITLIFARGGL